jgi:hypothetical protein
MACPGPEHGRSRPGDLEPLQRTCASVVELNAIASAGASQHAEAVEREILISMVDIEVMIPPGHAVPILLSSLGVGTFPAKYTPTE